MLFYVIFGIIVAPWIVIPVLILACIVAYGENRRGYRAKIKEGQQNLREAKTEIDKELAQWEIEHYTNLLEQTYPDKKIPPLTKWWHNI